jgi:hypothetical protein
VSNTPRPPALPSEPVDVDDVLVPLSDLLAAAERHEWAVVADGCGLEYLPAREMADHAIAALALVTAASIRIELTRGATIREPSRTGRRSPRSRPRSTPGRRTSSTTSRSGPTRRSGTG